ncbi:hypothetical protein [Granulicella sp. S156]|nr:hypothetical protein [Granulicella sp. S156]
MSFFLEKNDVGPLDSLYTITRTAQSRSIELRPGEILGRDGFVYADFLPA